MEHLSIVFEALPLFGAAILAEALVYRFHLRADYGWRESLSSFLVVVVSRPIVAVFAACTVLLFDTIHEYRLFTLTFTRWWHWVALFLATELVYYWFHRFNHTVRWMWASHSVHHTANQLTLSVAYRLGFTTFFSGTWLFFAPLILVGVPPTDLGLMMGINLLYQFWLHTELIPELGPLELFLNTPSQHRVHHATNPRYLDRNFGGVICLYDRLFGTYQREDEKCHYGVIPSVRSMNPFYLALHGWIDLFRDARQTARWKDRFALAVHPPGWKPEERHHETVNDVPLHPAYLRLHRLRARSEETEKGA